MKFTNKFAFMCIIAMVVLHVPFIESLKSKESLTMKNGGSFRQYNDKLQIGLKSPQLDLLNFFNDINTHKEHKELQPSSFSFKSRNTYRQGPSSSSSSSSSSISSSSSSEPTPSSNVAANATTPSPVDTSNIEIGKSEGEMIFGWWTISTPDFRNPTRYPPVSIPTGDVSIIQVNEEGYRLNAAVNCQDKSKPPESIWFYTRLNDAYIYYSSTKTDLNILGSLDLETVINLNETKPFFNQRQLYCFETQDKANKSWKMCHFDLNTYNSWICKIKKVIKQQDRRCISNLGESEINILTKNIVQPELVIPIPSQFCNENWDYQQNGADWECTCSEGPEQSPIDLPLPPDAIDSPVKPLFQYKEIDPVSTFSTLDGLHTKGQKMKITNENGLLQIENYDFGKIVTLDGAVYQAEQITFHTPSNHQINGKSFPLEISIIHYGVTKGDIAKQVVLSFLFEKKAGVYNKFLEDVDVYNLPDPLAKSREIDNKIYIPKILYSMKEDDDNETIMMKPFSFYTYQGSIPFPPCTERTINYVASTPLKVGSSILQLLQEALRVPDMINEKQGYDTNTNSSMDIVVSDHLSVSNRNIQPRNGRPIFYYDSSKYCTMEKTEKPKPQTGHYEKVTKDITQYFFVNGNKPSGIAGAILVPEKEALAKDAKRT